MASVHMRLLLRALPLIFLALPLCFSIDCYKCRDCSPNEADWRTSKKCSACMTQRLYVDGQVTKTTRRCQTKCSPIRTVIGGTGEEVTCCFTDLCNNNEASPIISPSSSTTRVLLGITLSIILINLHS